jgi:osmotically-inducible protein OsmY
MTDRELQELVQKALDWEPSVDAAEIGVSVDAGIVALRGDVKTYAEKAAAERVAQRVYGVKAVANDLNVHLGDGQKKTDTEIAQAVLSALKWNALVPDERLTVTVGNGVVTLQGQVDWDYQRTAATKAVRDLTGVRGVSNLITVEPHVHVSDVKAKIEAALRRNAEVDARRINVGVTDSKVILSGNVHSWFDHRRPTVAAALCRRRRPRPAGGRSPQMPPRRQDRRDW